MKCKNCGAVLEDNTIICSNCGAVQKVENKSDNDFVKFSEIEAFDEDAPIKQKKQTSVVKFSVISTILILIVGLVSGYFFYEKNISMPQPELSFTTGVGVINKSENVIYASFDNSSKVEYIHGVKLYEGEVDANSMNIDKELTSEYKYSKNMDTSFRAIFFDTEPLNLEDGTNHTFTFQITVSYYEDENKYTYYEHLNMTAGQKNDISDIIFDHNTKAGQTTTTSATESTTSTQSNTATTEQSTTQALSASAKYINDGYWYSSPQKDGNTYTISAIKFKEDGTYTITNYEKQGTSDWKVTTTNGTFTVSDDKVQLKNNAGTKIVEYTLNTNSQTISENINGKSTDLIKRNYNSLDNVEDFFGL